jgi:hypothetical protein
MDYEANFEGDPRSMAYQLSQMDKKTTEALATELREGYMQLKEIGSRCQIDMENITKNDRRVFYFKPNSVFLDDPERQKQFRQKVIDKIGEVKPPTSSKGIADQLDDEMRESMIDSSVSDPEAMRLHLVDFF